MTSLPRPPEAFGLDLLAVFAHPDDAELLCGGTLAAGVDQGERVGILDLTRGEAGTKGTPEIREAEAREAARVLGIGARACASLPDGRLMDDHPSRLVVAGWLRTLRPRVVVTHWLEGRHPDHRAAAALVTSAFFLAGLRKLEGVEGEPFRPERLVHATAFRPDAPPPSVVVDVSAVEERKLEALACYRSQFEGVSGIGEVYPAGDRPLLEQVRAHLAVDGARIRVRAGEPFVIREPTALPSLGALDRVFTF